MVCNKNVDEFFANEGLKEDNQVHYDGQALLHYAWFVQRIHWNLKIMDTIVSSGIILYTEVSLMENL